MLHILPLFLVEEKKTTDVTKHLYMSQTRVKLVTSILEAPQVSTELPMTNTTHSENIIQSMAITF